MMRLNVLSTRWILSGCIYLVIGIAWGVTMSAIHQYDTKGIHVHLNLLGWVSMVLMGLVYHHFPKASQSCLAQWHFWSYQLALPIMMGSLFAYFCGITEASPVIAASSVCILLSVVLFVFNLWRNNGPVQD